MGCGGSKKINVEDPVEHKKCLLIIDMQNDFITGSLMVGDAVDILPKINQCRANNKFDVIAHTMDSHPTDHCSFVDNHEGAETFALAMIPTPDGDGTMEQVMWPRHCVKGTDGWQMAKEMNVEKSDFIQRKGEDSQVDSYSGFFDNYKGRATGLGDELVKRGVTDVFVCGLAYDYCAGSSACDAAELGFKTYLIEDLTKAVSPATAETMKRSLKKAGVTTITLKDVPGLLAPQTHEAKKAHRMSFGGVVGVRLATYNTLKEARASVVRNAADEAGLRDFYSHEKTEKFSRDSSTISIHRTRKSHPVGNKPAKHGKQKPGKNRAASHKRQANTV